MNTVLINICRSIPYILFIPLIWWLGNVFCRYVLRRSGVQQIPAGSTNSASSNAGRYIGLFERMLIACGVLLGAWEVIAAVIALKTVARYKELDNQISAEYFLIGSLASLAWAVSTTIIFVIYDRHVGFSWTAVIIELLAKSKP